MTFAMYCKNNGINSIEGFRKEQKNLEIAAKSVVDTAQNKFGEHKGTGVYNLTLEIIDEWFWKEDYIPYIIQRLKQSHGFEFIHNNDYFRF